MTSTLRRPVSWATAAVLCAGVLGGCSSDPTAEEVVEDAVAATTAGPVTFAMQLDADEAGIATLIERVGEVAPLAAGATVRGALDGEDLALVVSLLDVDAFEVRQFGSDVFLRFDLSALGQLSGTRAEGLDESLLLRLGALDIEEGVVAGLLATLRGDWVEIERGPTEGDGVGATDGPTGTDGEGGVGSAVAAALGALVGTAEVVDHVGELGGDPPDARVRVRLDVAAALDAALDQLAGFAEGETGDALEGAAPGALLPGTFLVQDGRLRRVTLDLLPALVDATDAETDADGDGDEGGDAGTVDVVVELRETPDAEAIARPTPAASLTIDQLTAAVDALLGEG